MRTKLNIGLNNNPFTYDEVVQLVSIHGPVSARLVQGTYNGQVEPTAVIEVDHIFPVDWTKLADTCTQECIAVQDHQGGQLVFGSTYTGTKYQFDSNYFIQ